MTQLIVDTQGAQLRKRGERLVIEVDGQPSQSVPMGGLRQVILMGQGVNASTPLLYHLARAGIDVVFQSQNGRFAFRVVGPLGGHSALRRAQVQASLDPTRSLTVAHAMVQGKLLNQAALLGRYAASGAEALIRAAALVREQAGRADQARDVDALRGVEGSGAAAYFAAWPALLHATAWGFRGRAYHPPTDPLNALLSFGYALLLNDVTSALHRIGLDPAIGFLHTVEYGRPSLACDLEEEFRPVIVDSLVLSLVRQELLLPTDFRPDGEGGPAVALSDDARRFVIARYQERLGVRVRHPQWDQQLTYRQCLERQAEHLARWIAGREETYQPLLME